MTKLIASPRAMSDKLEGAKLYGICMAHGFCPLSLFTERTYTADQGICLTFSLSLSAWVVLGVPGAIDGLNCKIKVLSVMISNSSSTYSAAACCENFNSRWGGSWVCGHA